MRWLPCCSVALVVLVFGCAKREDATTEAEPTATVLQSEGPSEEVLTALLSRVDEDMSGGQTNAAIGRLVASLGDEQFEPFKPRVFRTLMQVHLMAGQVAEAKSLMTEAVRNDATCARAGLGLVAEHLRSTEGEEAMIGWMRELLSMDLPADLETQLQVRYLNAVAVSGDAAALLQAAEECIAAVTPADASRIFNHVVGGMIRSGKPVEAVAFLKGLSVLPDGPDVSVLLAKAQLEVLVSTAAWDALPAHLKSTRAELNAAVYDTVLRRALSATLGAGKTKIADQIVADALAGASPPIGRIARPWLESAKKQDDRALVLERLNKLADLALEPKQLFRLFSQHFYYLLEGPRDVQTKTLHFLESKLSADGNGIEKSQLQALMLDGAVLSDDYKRAVAVLEDGFRADDAGWHQMASNKVKAHLALQEGRKAEAVKRFRKFMAYLAENGEEAYDPMTGLRHSVNFSLGLNAKRIARILESTADAEGAKAAYAEARDYFEKAKAGYDEGSKEQTMVEDELASLPQ